MEKQTYAKIFKWVAWALILVSIAILVWGSAKGFETNDGAAVDTLLRWAYVMIGIALVSVVCVGLYISATTNPKSLLKMGGYLVAVAALCLVAYLLAPGSPAVGFTGTQLPTETELKMTDTILNLTYIFGGAAIVAIVIAEIWGAFRGKKA